MTYWKRIKIGVDHIQEVFDILIFKEYIDSNSEMFYWEKELYFAEFGNVDGFYT